MTDLDHNEQKEVIKQAIKEWLDEQYLAVGKWFVRSLLVAGVGAFIMWYITVRGMKFP